MDSVVWMRPTRETARFPLNPTVQSKPYVYSVRWQSNDAINYGAFCAAQFGHDFYLTLFVAQFNDFISVGRRVILSSLLNCSRFKKANNITNKNRKEQSNILNAVRICKLFVSYEQTRNTWGKAIEIRLTREWESFAADCRLNMHSKWIIMVVGLAVRKTLISMIYHVWVWFAIDRPNSSWPSESYATSHRRCVSAKWRNKTFCWMPSTHIDLTVDKSIAR